MPPVHSKTAGMREPRRSCPQPTWPEDQITLSISLYHMSLLGPTEHPTCCCSPPSTPAHCSPLTDRPLPQLTSSKSITPLPLPGTTLTTPTSDSHASLNYSSQGAVILAAITLWPSKLHSATSHSSTSSTSPAPPPTPSSPAPASHPHASCCLHCLALTLTATTPWGT